MASASDLRYTVQYRIPRKGSQWYTHTSYDARAEGDPPGGSTIEYRVLERFLHLAVEKHTRYQWRILEMPFNILAAQVTGQYVYVI